MFGMGAARPQKHAGGMLLSRSAHKGRGIIRVDLADFHASVNIRLIDLLDPAAAAVVTAGAEFAFRPAGAPYGLVDDPLPLLPGRVPDQK